MNAAIIAEKINIERPRKIYRPPVSQALLVGGIDIITLAKTSKDLDVLHPLTKNGNRPIQEAIKQVIEKQLNIPINIDYNYDGAGFGFNVDFYGVIKKLK